MKEKRDGHWDKSSLSKMWSLCSWAKCSRYAERINGVLLLIKSQRYRNVIRISYLLLYWLSWFFFFYQHSFLKMSIKCTPDLPFIPILSESFRFFPEKWPNSDFPIFLCWFRFFNGSDSDFWKSSFSGNSSRRKRRGSLKEPSHPPQTKRERKPWELAHRQRG